MSRAAIGSESAPLAMSKGEPQRRDRRRLLCSKPGCPYELGHLHLIEGFADLTDVDVSAAGHLEQRKRGMWRARPPIQTNLRDGATAIMRCPSGHPSRVSRELLG